MNEIDMITQERRRYMQAWRKKNKSRIAAYNKNFWLKRAKARLEEQCSDAMSCANESEVIACD